MSENELVEMTVERAQEVKINTEKEIRARFIPDEEICGFVMFDGEFIQIKNISENKSFHYVMEPVEQVQALMKGPADLIWHTHPNNLAIPSSIDLGGAQKNTKYLIYSGVEDAFRLWFFDGVKFVDTEW